MTRAFRWSSATQRINDFHAQRRVLTVPEVFTHSSNIGTAKMALDVGLEGHQEFLRRVGLFDRLQTELPESAKPLAAARAGASLQPQRPPSATVLPCSPCRVRPWLRDCSTVDT
jgi:cell division protein FtsI/penicillin-binding protein 2